MLGCKSLRPAAVHDVQDTLVSPGVREVKVPATHGLRSLCSFRDQEWQPEEHPRPLLHPVTLQAAAAAAAAVLPVPGGAQPADQQHCTVHQQPQNTRDAVQVGFSALHLPILSTWFGLEMLVDLKWRLYYREKSPFSDNENETEFLCNLFPMNCQCKCVSGLPYEIILDPQEQDEMRF